MANTANLAALGVGGFTRIDRRVDNGDGTFTFLLVGSAMLPDYQPNKQYTYDSSVSFLDLEVGDVIVVEITVGTYQMIRYHSKNPTGTITVKYDALLYPESVSVREAYYLGRVE